MLERLSKGNDDSKSVDWSKALKKEMEPEVTWAGGSFVKSSHVSKGTLNSFKAYSGNLKGQGNLCLEFAR